MTLIRGARPDDVGALARIFHDAVQIGSAPHYTQAQRDDWSRQCPTPDRWQVRIDGLKTFVAEDDTRPIGFLSMDDRPDGQGLIDLMFVTPERIGTGVAYALYCVALAQARARRLARMTVEASAQSEVFFTRQGWHITGYRDRGEGPTHIRTALMACDLAVPIPVPNAVAAG